MTTEEKIARMKQNLEVKNEFFVLDVIKHLEKQIEKMKCCQNCKHHSFWGDELKCNFFGYDEEMKCLNDKHGWELQK